MRASDRTAVYTAVALVIAGFVVIAFGWWGAARFDHTPAQIPYVISGGLSGLGLIGAGLTLVIVNELRRHRSELSARLDRALGPLVAARAGAASGAAGDEEADGAQQASENNHTGAESATTVVAGRSAYHRDACHLLHGRADLPHMAPEEALAQGLEPCRICAPGVPELTG